MHQKKLGACCLFSSQRRVVELVYVDAMQCDLWQWSRNRFTILHKSYA